jgi:GT2 family glycosyltransferase
MKVSIIIPSYRRFSPLLNTLEDLKKQAYQDFEIIVVDQNPEWPEELKTQLKEIQQDSRILWITQEKPEVVIARNTAVAHSQGEILIFIDDDVEISDPKFIHKHVLNFEDPEIHVVAGRECSKASASDPSSENESSIQQLKNISPLQQTLWFNRNSDHRMEICTFSTCNGSIRKSTFLAVGGFDENFRGNSYGDDYDLILRLHKLGYRSVYDPKPFLVHLRVPMGGLRMSDVKNQVNHLITSTGFWLFLFRHGTPTMYWHILFNHVLRKTIFLRVNLSRPWRQFFVIPGVTFGFFRAYALLLKGPTSRLSSSYVNPNVKINTNC